MMQRKPFEAIFVISFFACPGPSAAELSDGVLFVCDSADDRVLRLEDLDFSGAIEAVTAGEISVFFDESGDGPTLSVPSHLAIGPGGGLFLLDGGTLDSILVLRDGNGDGDANDAGEVLVFYDNSGAGPRLATPNTLLFSDDGTLLVSDDGSSARRLLRLRDSNGDGDALDEGEAAIVYDQSSAAPVILEDPESLARAPDGALFVGDSTRGAVFRLLDRDGNGDFLGVDEAAIYYQSSAPLELSDLDALVYSEDALYAANEDSGLVLCLRDLDGSGDANGPGEATVFLDVSAAPGLRDLNDVQLAPGGGLLLLDGVSDSVYLAADRNGDGDALDEEEVERLLEDGGAELSTPSGLAYRDARPAGTPEFLRGDINSDRILNITDGINILEFLFLGGPPGKCLDASDADDSGDLNVSDPLYLLVFLFQGGRPPPPPFPDTGPDPTPDAIACKDS